MPKLIGPAAPVHDSFLLSFALEIHRDSETEYSDKPSLVRALLQAAVAQAHFAECSADWKQVPRGARPTRPPRWGPYGFELAKMYIEAC